MITALLLQQLCPNLDAGTAGLSAPRLQTAADRFGISTRLRLAHWLAQLAQESGFKPAVENLNYSAQRLTQVWPSRFPTLTSAQRCAHNPEALANTVYAGRLGNGGPESGDGARFIGRGFVQITGRANYAKYGDLIGIDLIAQPQLAAQFGAGALIAGAFWQDHGLNRLADKGGMSVAAITQIINGGLTGLPERQAYFQQAVRLLLT
jgi:putative chitinase